MPVVYNRVVPSPGWSSCHVITPCREFITILLYLWLFALALNNRQGSMFLLCWAVRRWPRTEIQSRNWEEWQGRFRGRSLVPNLRQSRIQTGKQVHAEQETSLFSSIVSVMQFVTSETTESFVSRTNALLVGSLIPIGDVSASIALAFLSPGGREPTRPHRLPYVWRFS